MDTGLWADVACVALDRGVRFLLIGGAGQLRRSPRGAAAEGQRPAAGPCGRLAHGEPPLGRARLPVYQLAPGWGSRGGAFGRGGEAGAARGRRARRFRSTSGRTGAWRPRTLC